MAHLDVEVHAVTWVRESVKGGQNRDAGTESLLEVHQGAPDYL